MEITFRTAWSYPQYAESAFFIATVYLIICILDSYKASINDRNWPWKNVFSVDRPNSKYVIKLIDTIPKLRGEIHWAKFWNKRFISTNRYT